MRPELGLTHKRIEDYPCFAPNCKATTKDWIDDGWLTTGYFTKPYFSHQNRPNEISREAKQGNRETYVETAFARDELVAAGKIEASEWSVAYVCADHRGEIEEFINAQP